MSAWAIRVPHRALDESLAAAAGHCHTSVLGADATVSREIILGGYLAGDRTVRDLLTRLERMDATQRRALLDAATAECGLESVEMIDAGERIRQASRPFALTMCHAPGCTAVPVAEGGVLSTPRVKRWFCPVHVDQAEPGDMEPQGFGVRYGEHGVIVPDDPADRHRERVAAESREHALKDRDAQAAVEAEQIRRHQQAIREQTHREIPESMRRFFP